jgi:hypothetical protein
MKTWKRYKVNNRRDAYLVPLCNYFNGCLGKGIYISLPYVQLMAASGVSSLYSEPQVQMDACSGATNTLGKELRN